MGLTVPSLSELTYSQAILIAFGLVVVGALVVAASTSGTAFGAYTSTWEGGSELRTISADAVEETIVVTNASQYDDLDGNGTVAFVIAPEEHYDDRAAARLRAFVERGGTVVVAESKPTPTNDLLDQLDSRVRVDGDPLRDERNYYRSPALPVATGVSDHSLVADGDDLTLNHGTALIVTDAGATAETTNTTNATGVTDSSNATNATNPSNVTVLIESSEYAYLDRNRNERLDGDERMGAYPVVTSESIGSGELIVVSDPSVFINVMLERDGNRAFVEALVTDRDRVVIDTSHAENPPPLVMATLVLRGSTGLQIGLALLIVGVILAWERGSLASAKRHEKLATARRYGRPLSARREWQWFRTRLGTSSAAENAELDDTAVRALLEDEFPDWDENRRERVVTAAIDRRSRSQPQSANDEAARRDDKS